MKSDEINETNEMNNEMHNEIETELSLAWEDITSNKNAINVIDKNVEGITSDIKTISEKQEDYNFIYKYVNECLLMIFFDVINFK